jgi:hypothetical protein
MALPAQIRGIREDKREKLAKLATRPHDMPPCCDCHKPGDPLVAGYDDCWRCIPCNAMHAAAVLRESGNSAPNESENRPGVVAVPKPEQETARQARAKRILEKYGVERRGASWS